jgi:hypothetical protein
VEEIALKNTAHKFDIPFVKKSLHKPFDVSHKTLNSIAEFYAADFEAFGYDRDPEPVLAARDIVIADSSAFRWLLSPRA